MAIPDFTIVLGLDAKHFEQLRIVWPTWKRHKPSLLSRRFVVFFDREWLSQSGTPLACDLIPDQVDLTTYPWPPDGVDYGTGTTKWDNPQRHKMLAGFLHVAAHSVQTPYWLKLDTDAIATGMDDWIDPAWFEGMPAIVAPPWHYTKPPNQLVELDRWAAKHGFFPETPPLNLVPAEGASLIKHPRIGGWCNFFHTGFTRQCAKYAADTVGPGKMPVPSLDGYLFYAATRLSLPIHRVNMKTRGWEIRNSMGSISEAAERALA